MRNVHREHAVVTCLIAVTVMTKNSGKPLVTGLVGVSTITYRKTGKIQSAVLLGASSHLTNISQNNILKSNR